MQHVQEVQATCYSLDVKLKVERLEVTAEDNSSQMMKDLDIHLNCLEYFLRHPEAMDML